MNRLFLFVFLLMASVAVAQTSTTTGSATAPPADTTNLTAYAGTYTFGAGLPLQKMTITTEGRDLYGEADSYGRYKLLKQDEPDTYKSTSSYGSIIVFSRDASTGRITGLTLRIMGQEAVAKREP